MMEEILKHITEEMDSVAKDMSLADQLMMQAGYQHNLVIGMKWAEESAEVDLGAHEDISMPLYVVLSEAVSKLVNTETATLLSVLIGLVIELAVQKGYEKGKREALASLVLEEGGK